MMKYFRCHFCSCHPSGKLIGHRSSWSVYFATRLLLGGNKRNLVPEMPPPAPASMQVVMPTASPSLRDDIAFFGGVLRMRMESIFPADDPSVAVFEGHGARVRIERMKDAPVKPPPTKILLFCDDPSDFSKEGEEQVGKVFFISSEQTISTLERSRVLYL